ncbi:RNA polymerase sigma factor [Lentzea sp. BCCO 10_0856]|uniref:RNA polymerase sigma factor n=2 Tax=Lentzea miocenica TaxID=3095431 RepID=A0ABU4T047_9PSEU|nr:RNA polymerase sigma factor [Lentzea sp. BCCO 10_0856]MDX8031534.1 RNA polymerase sigma factor [Lentzea sp. BCCO 10_0856]
MRPSWEGAAAVPDDALSDAELWARGDEQAFGELFDRYAEAVWNHAYRLTASWSTAEDLTSATFMTAWRRRAQMTLVRDSALPWLFTVAGNLARSEFRRKERFTRLLLRVPRNDVQRDHADDVVSSLDHEARLSQVLQAVERLPRAEREAVELVLLGELSAAEAAEALGVAEVSVRSRISRARTRLRKVLADDTLEVE